MKERYEALQKDPFGNLIEWGPVLNLLYEMREKGELADYQPGLVRILRYKGNWRLREEVLKQMERIKNPCEDLCYQVLAILNDDNVYYDVRILAATASMHLLQNAHNGYRNQLIEETQRVVERLTATPQPLYLEAALKRLGREIDSRSA